MVQGVKGLEVAMAFLNPHTPPSKFSNKYIPYIYFINNIWVNMFYDLQHYESCNPNSFEAL